MKNLTVILLLSLLFNRFACAEVPATQPAFAASEAVTNESLDFQIVAPAVWVVPVGQEKTIIALALKVTNRTDQPVKFAVDGSLNITLKDATGKELPVAEGVDGVAKADAQPPVAIAPHSSINLERTAQLGILEPKKDGYWLAGGNGGMAFWRFSGLQLGQYTVGMTYENEPEQLQDVWMGKVSTKELPVEIADSISASSKPAVKDGLSVTVMLPARVFAADEPIHFSVQFKNVSNKDFSLYDADFFWDWAMQFHNTHYENDLWQLHEAFLGMRSPVPVTHFLKPGEAFELPVAIDPKFFEFGFEGSHKAVPRPLQQLPPGSYRLTAKITLGENPGPREEFTAAAWTGTITTEPVDFQITNQNLPAATQPATTAAAETPAADSATAANAAFTPEKAAAIVEKWVAAQGQSWGKATSVTACDNEFTVAFATPSKEIAMLGPRAVTVNARTGKVSWVMPSESKPAFR